MSTKEIIAENFAPSQWLSWPRSSIRVVDWNIDRGLQQGGFWAEWFVEASDQVRFIEHLLRWPCYGDPEFTFSDVERALRQEVRARDYLSRYREIAGATLRAREVAVLEKLEAKYRRPPASSNDVEGRDRRPSHEMSSPIPVPTVPVQGPLF